MDFSTFNIVRGIFAVFVVLGAVQPSRSQAFKFDKEPDIPLFVVLGVNNTYVELEWTFTLGSQTVNNIFLSRKRPGEMDPVTIAGRTETTLYEVKQPYVNDYSMKDPATLVIKEVTKAEDESLYTISILLTGDFSPKLRSTRIKVLVPPQITQHPKRKTEVDIGQNVTLHCNASGDPLPNIMWTRDGVPASDFNVSGHVLHLVNVQRRDAGSYRCTATNGYGPNVTSVGLVSINCPGCESKKAEITLIQDWKNEYSNEASEEYKDLQSRFLAGVYGAYAQHPEKGLSRVVLDEIRRGSVIALVEMLFPQRTSDPFKPLQDEMADGKLGPYLSVNPTLNQNPTSPPPTSSSTGTTVSPPTDPGKRTDDEGGLTDGELVGIVVGCVLAVLIIVFIIVYCCCCKKKNSGGGGATKVRPKMQQSVATHDSGMGGVKSYSEEDAYAMNRGPPANRPSHSAGIGSPAYVEASMYAPANASRKQEDQPKQLNYADLSFNNSSAPTNMPPRYSGTEYSEPSPSRRPPQGEGEGAQPGEKGFELWC